MKNLKNILTILLFTVLCACNSDDDNNPNDNNNYFKFEFLKVGNKWEYEISYYDTDGNSVDGKIIDDDFNPYETYEITAMKKHNNCYWEECVWENQFVVNDDNNIGFFENANSITLRPDICANASVIFKNYYKGQKWEIREITSINETVTVPAGKFHNCIKIVSKFYGETNIEYISPKYGMIMCTGTLYYTENDVGKIGKSVRQLKSKNF